MSFGGWLLTFTVVVLLFVVAIGVGWWLRNKLLPPTPNGYTNIFTWGPPQDGANPAKNFCQLYQFPTIITNINGQPTAVPGVPTYSSSVLDNLAGKNFYPTCLDTDQILAQQIQRTCVAPEGVVDGSKNLCFDINGNIVPLGGTEQYYTNAGCFRTPACVGQIALLSVNYQVPSNFNINCVVNNGTGNNVSMAPCDPTNNAQIFRFTRINPGQDPKALLPGQGQNGLIAQILDRNTGLCVQPGSSTITAQYDPSYLSAFGCGGPSFPVQGQDVVVSACTGGLFPGYVWAFVPPLVYCPETDVTKCNATNTTQSPPQIAYVGNLDFNTFPGATGYKGLSGSSAIVQWFLDGNATSMLYGAGDNKLILTPFSIDGTKCLDRAKVSQYLNVSIYNTIQKQAVCQGSSDVAACIGL